MNKRMNNSKYYFENASRLFVYNFVENFKDLLDIDNLVILFRNQKLISFKNSVILNFFDLLGECKYSIYKLSFCKFVFTPFNDMKIMWIYNDFDNKKLGK